MTNTRRYITLKVVAGYVIIAILAGIAVWYVYNQVVEYSEIAQSNTENNLQLILLSEITTDLNESENTSRRLIQSGNEEELLLYDKQIESIKNKLSRLEESYQDIDLEYEADSIQSLLSKKTENLKELIALRRDDRNTNYYAKALRELRNIDASFKDYNYENRFQNLKSYQKDILVKWLEYSRQDNTEQITTERLDSVVKSVKRVLIDLEYANRQFQNEIVSKESELLTNDMTLNQQLRNLLSGLEKKERQNSLERAELFQDMLQSTSNSIIIGGAVIGILIIFFIINIIGDITRSQRYRRQLEEAKEFAESLLSRREQFMAAITHDLRSPLTTVMGYADLVQKTELDERQKHYLTQISKSSEFILRLVNDLLDLSKLEAGKMLIEKVPFRPKKLIEDTVSNVIPAEKKKDVEVIVIVDKDTDVQIESDPFRIKQILANLISNAWKFTEEGKITISANLQKKRKDRHILELKVRDSGIGISKEMQESIFEEFSQENSNIEKQFGGTGLGLAITKRLTELLQGSIGVESEQGKGSEFTILIPVEKVSEKSPGSSEKMEAFANADFKDHGLQALVVDDEPGQLSLTTELIKSMNIRFDTADHGKAAVDKLATGDYDILLTDIQMPIMDGFQLIREIRSSTKYATLPVIALSGRTDLTKDVYIDAGFNAKLLKPCKPSELKKHIADLLKIEPIEQPKKDISQKDHLIFEHYDLSEVFEFSGGDEDAMSTILQAFLEGAKKSMQEIETAFKQNNTEELGKLAHRMLPMLRQMKAVHVIPYLVKMEARENLQDSEFNSFRSKLNDLINGVEEEITV